jgi:hypothetical protein
LSHPDDRWNQGNPAQSELNQPSAHSAFNSLWKASGMTWSSNSIQSFKQTGLTLWFSAARDSSLLCCLCDKFLHDLSMTAPYIAGELFGTEPGSFII